MSQSEADSAKARGNEKFKAKQFPEAITEYTQAIKLDPNNPVLYSNRSACYAELEKWRESLADAEKSLQLKPSFAKAFSRKGLALLKLKQVSAATKAYQEGLKLDPSNEQLQEGLRECQRATKQSQESLRNVMLPTIQRLRTHPKFAQRMKDPQFVSKLEQSLSNPALLSGDPEIMQAWTAMFEAGTGTGDAASKNPRESPFTSSVPSAEAGDESLPDAVPFPSFAAGSAARGRGASAEEDDDDHEEEDQPVRPSPSRVASKPSAAAAAPSAAARPQKAAAAASSGSEQKKSEDDEGLTPEQQAKRQEANTLKEEANKLYHAQKFEEALPKYSQAIETDPANPPLYLNRAAVYLEMKRFAECIADCNKALEIAATKPKHNYQLFGKTHARIAACYAKQEKYDEAIAAYDRSLLEHSQPSIRKKQQELVQLKKLQEEKAYINPELGAEANKRGNSFFQEGKWVDAITEYSEAIRRNPDEPKYYSNRSACYTKLMDWGKALADCDNCLQLDPKFVKVLIRKGKIHHMLKQYHKALDFFNQAMKIDPECSDLVEARHQTLEAIQKELETGKVDPERARRAMEDPEIKAILNDVTMQKVLEDMSGGNSAAMQAHMRDPRIRANVDKLLAAGVLSFGKKGVEQDT